MYIDTHAHLQDSQLVFDVQNILQRAKESNVKKIICSSWNYPSSFSAVELANKYDCVFASIGVHPENCEEYSEQVEKDLIDLAKQNKVCAIGEIGLDYHYTKENKELQKQVFACQIVLADKLGLPIVIHTRDAMGDTLQVLRENKQYINHGGVFHCFNGSKQVLDEIIKMGFFVSYGGVTTFANAKDVKEIVAYTPLDRLLTETDCPYLAPVPLRGSKNEPKNISIIIKNIAQIKNIEINELEKIIENNTKKIYNI